MQLPRCSEGIMIKSGRAKVKELSTEQYRIFYDTKYDIWNDEKRYYIMSEDNSFMQIREEEVQPKSIRETLRNIEENKEYFHKKTSTPSPG